MKALSNNGLKVLEILKIYTGTNCMETLYNRIEIILNDSYVGHLSILKEDFNISKKEIIYVQNSL